MDSNVQNLPANYTTGVKISQPQMFTIRPIDSGLSLFIERQPGDFGVRIAPADRIAQRTTPIAVALSPTANICAVIQKSKNSILLLETITNSPYGNPITAGDGPVALTFAADGKRLFVANAGDSTLTVFDVTFSESSDNYVFTKVTDVSLSGVPVAVAASADGGAIFVTSNNNNANPGSLDVVTSSDGTTYMVTNSVAFKGQVGPLAVLPSSAQVFVLGGAAQTVYVVGYDSIHQSYQWVRSIDGFDPSDKPVDVAIAGQDFGTLLIACSGTNSVYCVSKEVSSVAGRQKLRVGNHPTRRWSSSPAPTLIPPTPATTRSR